MGFTLKITRGPGAGQSLRFDQPEVSFGRTDDNDVVLYDPNVSRRHFHIIQHNGGYVLEDLGSSNGTMVNGGTVQQHRLADGDQVEVGDAVFVFGAEAARPARSAPPARRARAAPPAARPAEPAPPAARARTGVPAQRARAAPPAAAPEAPRSVRERYARRKAAQTPIGRLKNWFSDLPRPKQILFGGAGAMVVVVFLALAFQSAGKGEGIIQIGDMSSEVFELVPEVSRATFGWKVGEEEAPTRYEANFQFRYLDGRATLYYEAGFVDSEQEIEIRLNDERIVGYAPLAIKTWSGESEIVLPYDALLPNEFNKITFDNTNNPGDGPLDPWGIRRVRVVEEQLPEPDPVMAQEKYKVALKRWDERAIGPGNLHDACVNFKLTRDYLERMDIKPPLYEEAGARVKDCNVELTKTFQQLQFTYQKFLRYRDWESAKGTLLQMLEYFPEDTDRRHQWVQGQLEEFN